MLPTSMAENILIYSFKHSDSLAILWEKNGKRKMYITAPILKKSISSTVNVNAYCILENLLHLNCMSKVQYVLLSVEKLLSF